MSLSCNGKSLNHLLLDQNAHEKMISGPQLPFPAEGKVLVDLSYTAAYSSMGFQGFGTYKVFSFENRHMWQLLCAVLSCVPSLGQKTQQERGEVCVLVYHNK